MAGRSRWILILAAGLAAFLAAGAGAYLYARDVRAGQVTQSCGARDCIPGVEAAALVEALKGRGHACENPSKGAWSCQMVVGSIAFQSWVHVSDGGVHRLTGKVFHADGGPLTEAGRAYLSWFAVLPYRDDPAAAAQIRDWLTQMIEADKDTKATILDYTYVLVTSKDDAVELDVRIST
ncbi:hypothetical protein [Nonomuraea candida]|uniref:hypothetical protein n=1 Tax=Nonomuraea candida TaxID=359159 RepID=UPI0005BA6C40|nr:hypothetical protein [Nonomuraea candida]